MALKLQLLLSTSFRFRFFLIHVFKKPGNLYHKKHHYNNALLRVAFAFASSRFTPNQVTPYKSTDLRKKKGYDQKHQKTVDLPAFYNVKRIKKKNHLILLLYLQTLQILFLLNKKDPKT